MSLPEFVVSIWVSPHRGYGHFIEVDASDADEGLAGGVFQSFEHVPSFQRYPSFQPDYPHREIRVTVEQVQALLKLADKIRYSFAEHAFTPMLGGSFFGLRVARGFQEVTVMWHGRFEDQESEVLNLYSAVQALAEA